MDDEKNKGPVLSSEKNIEEICNSTWKELYRYIYDRVQNREEAEDIMQKAYAAMISYLKQNHPPVSGYDGLLKAAAFNIIRDRGKLKKKNKSVTMEEILWEDMITEDFSEQANNRAYVETALEYLTQEQRMVIALRVIKGYSTKETAKIMKKKAGDIRVLLYRSLKALTEILNKSNAKGGL